MNYYWNTVSKMFECCGENRQDHEHLRPCTSSDIVVFLTEAVMHQRKFELIRQHMGIFGSELLPAKIAIEAVMPHPCSKQTADDVQRCIALFAEKIPELLTPTDSTMGQCIIDGVTSAVQNWRTLGYKSPVHAAAEVVKNYATKHGYVHGEVWSADAMHATA